MAKVPRLFEIQATVTVTAVILAMSEADALSHVETWERAWLNAYNADFTEVTCIDCIDSRATESTHWPDEAHDATVEALELVPKTKGEAR